MNFACLKPATLYHNSMVTMLQNGKILISYVYVNCFFQPVK